MELSLEIITESMKRFQGALLLADDQPFSFRRIKLLSEEDFQNLAEDTLYVGLPKTLRKLPRSDFRGHCFVFPAKQSAVERYKGYINAIVFNEATPISEVINHLMELFQRIQVLELKMQIAIRSANPYLSLMEVAREMFPNSVMIIVDSAYNIIAASHDSTNKNSDVDGLLRQGFYDKSYLQKMLAYGYFDQGDRYLKPQVSHRPNIAGVPMLIRSFHNSGIFYSFVTCYFMEDPPDLLDQYLFSVFTEQLDVFFEESGDGELKQNLLDVYFELRDFLAAAESFDENYQAYEEIGDENEFFLKLFCMNPAARITEQIDKGRSAVFFSATLLPVDYYKRLLTTREDPYAIYAPSPFDTGKRLLLVAGDVSTRFASRGIETYRRIAQYILDTARSKTGNYLVFFPSHRMMRDVYEVYKEEFDSPDVNYVMQSSMMLEDDREIFLENFYEDPERSLVGFCVMGGSFSEGLDLAGTRLIGAVIVGAGIPQLSNEREILKEYYDGLDAGSGFDYAYRFPGINKVQQAAGRVIRTETDTGVILLLDDRLLTRSYQRLFPLEWSNYERCTAGSLPEQLEKFWNSW